MERYDYRKALENDIREAIAESLDYSGDTLDDMTKDEALERFSDELWIDDSVTGNASGSYYCNEWLAEEAISHNLDLLRDALEEFGGDAESYKRALESPETADVTIRCYLLGEVLADVLDELM